MKKLHIRECICTSCNERVRKCVHWCHNTYLTYKPAHAWCSEHLSECMHTLRKKYTCTRACTPMQWCRNFFAMETIANLSWVLCEHRASCHCNAAQGRGSRSFDACLALVSTKSVARRCSLKKFVQIHASSWYGRRCGVAHASFDHPRWCRPHSVCLRYALKTWPRGLPDQKCNFRYFSREFSKYVCVVKCCCNMSLLATSCPIDTHLTRWFQAYNVRTESRWH